MKNRAQATRSFDIIQWLFGGGKSNTGSAG